jgi:hypothetical protein
MTSSWYSLVLALFAVRAIAAPENDWWSLQPLERPAVPALSTDELRWVRTPIDAFVIAQLREHGLAPSAPADRRTLIRRLYFDLVGLPPSPEAVSAFVSDDDPLAYEKLVDRLLASPHYGERWARHWLDVVHYGDTHGYDKDKPRPHAWPYRDYVIRSFNQDKPYARFVQEQIAGDVLWPDDPEAIVATGFIAAGPWDFIGHAEVPETKIDGQVARNLDRDDMVSSTMNTFASITVQCARCHDHKFDPITQEHYYSLQAVFAALDRADRLYDASPDVARERRRLIERRELLEQRKTALQDLVGRLDSEATDAARGGSSRLEATNRDLAQVTASLELVLDELAALPPQAKVYAGTVHHGEGPFLGTGPTGGKPRAIHILARGDVKNPGKRIGPGALPLIPGVPWRFDLAEEHSEGERRAALAEWLVHNENPLTWRSIVNRVCLYHFGQGIVQTPNDFGRMGQLPTHPGLLDWLAVWFRDSGQSLKSLHRLIITSSVYRQSSSHNEAFARIDAENEYLWRMNRRALDAESLHDAVLTFAGQLDTTMYGPGFQDFVMENPEHSPHYQYHKHDVRDPSCHRRAVYRFLVRSQPHPFMQTLNCADPSQSVPQRDTTQTALQALTLLNNRFMVYMSSQLAAQVVSIDVDRSAQVQTVFQRALGRTPSDEEKAVLVRYAEQFGLANTCRAIVNLNEFMFVD